MAKSLLWWVLILNSMYGFFIFFNIGYISDYSIISSLSCLCVIAICESIEKIGE